MTDDASALPVIDAAGLTPMVAQLLRLDDAEVTEWHHQTFGHTFDEVYGHPPTIFQYAGTARSGNREVPWTMVLKIVNATATPDDPSSPANGEREPLAYRSGFLDNISGVRAPRCFGVVERPTGGFWLWLEHVVEAIGREWPLERYALAARHLARFNASYLADRTPVSYPWLSRSPLRDAVREFSPGVLRIREARDNPFVSQAISPHQARLLLTVVDKIESWLDALDRMPQAVCHWDAHRANLLSRISDDGTVETVAIDWAGVGWGPIGSEPSKLLSQTVNFFGLSVDTLSPLDAAMFADYVKGLRETGWRGDERTVRFGHTAASAARLIVRTAMAIELALNERARAGFERTAGVPFTVLADKFRAALPYYLSLVEEADRLAHMV